MAYMVCHLETRKAFFEALHAKRAMILVEREEQTAQKKKNYTKRYWIRVKQLYRMYWK